MACDELKAERKKITAETINEHQLATTAGTSTGQFKCGRCGKRNTTYNQVPIGTKYQRYFVFVSVQNIAVTSQQKATGLLSFKVKLENSFQVT